MSPATAEAARRSAPTLVAGAVAVFIALLLMGSSPATVLMPLPEAAAAEASTGEDASTGGGGGAGPVGEVDTSLTDAGEGPQGPDGLRPRAAKVRSITRERWGCTVIADPCVASIGGYAKRNIAGTGTVSDHATGRAADIMIPDYRGAGRALGDEIAGFYVANADVLAVRYVIWFDRIWLPSVGWKDYDHPGGGDNDTLQHRDHVHISVKTGA